MTTIDVLVATVGQRDVADLTARPGEEEPPRPEARLYRHPILQDRRPRLRWFGTEARKWVTRGGDKEAQERAIQTRLPLLDAVLEHLSDSAGDPPAVWLVATDQVADDFKPGDTVELARFIQEVLRLRDDRLTHEVTVHTVNADPSSISQVLEAVRPLVEELCKTPGRSENGRLRVGLATTGGTPALTHAVTLRCLAAAHTGSFDLVELRVGPKEGVEEGDLAAVRALLRSFAEAS